MVSVSYRWYKHGLEHSINHVSVCLGLSECNKTIVYTL
jgi:hypothetical protein